MTNNSRFTLLANEPGDVIVIAHRGASSRYPENTMAAFRAAAEMDADMIELDVMLSKDGVPVVFHDVKLNTHTNGNGFLSDYTVAELKKLNAGSWYGEEFYAQKIPTLAEVLDFASAAIALNIEIKTEAVSDQLAGGIEEKCLQLVKEYNMGHQVLFSSFDYQAIVHLRELDPYIPLAVLYEKKQSARKNPLELVKVYQVDAFNCSYQQFNNKWSKQLQTYSIPHFIYTVDRPNRMHKLLNAGVSGIITNKPGLLKAMIH